MKTILIALAVGTAMSAITALVLLLTIGGGDPDIAPTTSQPVLATAAEAQAARANAPSVSIAETTSLVPAADFDPAAVYERVAPAVVTITTDLGEGSGFFIDHDGHIVTNFHVVDGAQEIIVGTWTGEHTEAELIGTDPANDLAVIRVDHRDVTIGLLDYAELDGVRVGDRVAAVGAPYGLEHSLSIGIIAGLDRTLRSAGPTERAQFAMIQTDAALNPGNSGGVLVNGAGELVGVPSRIESPIRAWTGVAFAIPVDTLLRVLPRMLAGEHIEHPRLGVVIGENFEVTNILPGSAADRANLRVGDVILGLDGHPIDSFASLIATLEQLRVGETASIQLQRGGDAIELTIDLEAWTRAAAPTLEGRLAQGAAGSSRVSSETWPANGEINTSELTTMAATLTVSRPVRGPSPSASAPAIIAPTGIMPRARFIRLTARPAIAPRPSRSSVRLASDITLVLHAAAAKTQIATSGRLGANESSASTMPEAISSEAISRPVAGRRRTAASVSEPATAPAPPAAIM